MQDNIISLLDENGVESQFEVILTLEANNKEYAVLMPVEDEEEEINFEDNIFENLDKYELIEKVNW